MHDWNLVLFYHLVNPLSINLFSDASQGSLKVSFQVIATAAECTKYYGTMVSSKQLGGQRQQLYMT